MEQDSLATSTQSSDNIKTETTSNESNVDPVYVINQLLLAECGGDDATFNDAITLLEATTKPMPGDSAEATRLNKVGLKYLKDKNYVEAVKFFGWAANADPSDPKYPSNLGFAEMNAGDLNSAKNHLYASIALAPSRSVAWGDLGENFAKQRDQEKQLLAF